MSRRFPIAVTAGALALAAATAQAQPKQGGEMVVTYKDDISTFDPAIGYDWQNWSMIKSLFDGLMDYAPGTTELIPDLAESYEISADGKTYTFKLREGVTFHNGRELTADDVKWSIERVVRPETQSPGQGFFGTIAGIDPYEFAIVVGGVALLIFIGSAVAGSYRGRTGQAVRDLPAWLAVALALVAGYSYREELAVVGYRVVGELLPPGSPLRETQVEGKQSVTFSDAITAVRRWLWVEWVFAIPGYKPAFQKLPLPFRCLLLNALAPAA